MTKSTIAILFLLFSCSFTKAQQWEQITSLPVFIDSGSIREVYEDMFFLDENLGWIVSSRGYVYNTKNGGKTWHLISKVHGSNRKIRNTVFLDSLHGFYSLSNLHMGLFETFDGGITWSTALLPPNETISSVYSLSSYGSNMYLCYRNYDGENKMFYYDGISRSGKLELPPTGMNFVSYKPINDTLGYIVSQSSGYTFIGEKGINFLSHNKYLEISDSFNQINGFATTSISELTFTAVVSQSFIPISASVGTVDFISNQIRFHSIPNLYPSIAPNDISYLSFQGCYIGKQGWIATGATKLIYTNNNGFTYSFEDGGLNTMKLVKGKDGFLYGLGRDVVRLDISNIQSGLIEDSLVTSNGLSVKYDANTQCLIGQLKKHHSLGSSFLYDVSGKLVKSVSLSDNGSFIMDVSMLPSNMYVVEYRSAIQREVKKVYIKH